MLRRSLLSMMLPAFALAQAPKPAWAEERPRFRVFRDPGCGCCLGWVRHMQQAGFEMRVEERSRTDPVRRTSGAPSELRGCHMALHDRFAFEGHVPAPAIRRFLANPGSWRGLAVPGMPAGSPGMEVESVPLQTYEIIRYDQAGHSELYARATGGELI
jgi:hypothetical protein